MTLNDKSGTHGEIRAILIDANDVVKAFVMSCRVFQLRAEFALLGGWRAGRGLLEVEETSRNEPATQFLADPAF